MRRALACLFATVVAAGSGGVAGQGEVRHASADLLTLADKFTTR